MNGKKEVFPLASYMDPVEQQICVYCGKNAVEYPDLIFYVMQADGNSRTAPTWWACSPCANERS